MCENLPIMLRYTCCALNVVLQPQMAHTCRTAVHSPVASCHNLTVLSALPLAKCLPSGLYATLVISSVCPCDPPSTPHTRTDEPYQKVSNPSRTNIGCHRRDFTTPRRTIWYCSVTRASCYIESQREKDMDKRVFCRTAYSHRLCKLQRHRALVYTIMTFSDDTSRFFEIKRTYFT